MKTTRVIILSMAILVIASKTSFAFGYTFTVLGPMDETSQAFAINNSSQIAGKISSHAIVWNGTTATNLTSGAGLRLPQPSASQRRYGCGLRTLPDKESPLVTAAIDRAQLSALWAEMELLLQNHDLDVIDKVTELMHVLHNITPAIDTLRIPYQTV